MAHLSEKNGAKFVMVSLPSMGHLEQEYATDPTGFLNWFSQRNPNIEYESVQKQLLSEANAAGLAPSQLCVNDSDCSHPNRMGNYLIARVLADYIRGHGLNESSRAK